MKETTYSKHSWHYRINTSQNMLIPHLLNNQYKWHVEEKQYTISAPTDACTYWRHILFYFLFQIPLMFMGGTMVLLLLALCPLFFVFVVCTQPYIDLDNGMMLIGFIVSIIYIAIGTCFVMAFVGKKYHNVFNYDITPNVIHDIAEMYSSLKNKYCKKINFE